MGAPLTQFDDANLAVRSKCVRALRLLGCHGAQECEVAWAALGILMCGLTVFVGPIMVTFTYTALRCAEAYPCDPCVLLVGGGICQTGFRGRWEQRAVGSDGSAETEISADGELQPASSCIR